MRSASDEMSEVRLRLPFLVREGPSSADLARPTCIEVLEGGMVTRGIDAGRLATAVGIE